MTELQLSLRVAFVGVGEGFCKGCGVKGFAMCFAGETEMDVDGEEGREEEGCCEEVKCWI